MEVENVSIEEIELGGHGNGENSDDSGVNNNKSGDEKQNNIIKKPSPVLDGILSKRRGSKKLIRQNSRENGGVAHVNGLHNFVAPQRRWKNSRRSRNGYGRGLPKKGGAGGKGVWGLPGSELLEEEAEIDQNDPNYDPETHDGNVELREVIAEPTPEEFFKPIEDIILEYFEHGDTHEVARSLDEIVFGSLRPYVTTYSIQVALDHKDSQREMVSVLISDLYGRVVTSRDIAKGMNVFLLYKFFIFFNFHSLFNKILVINEE